MTRQDFPLDCITRPGMMSRSSGQPGVPETESGEQLVARLVTGSAGLNAMGYAAFARHDQLIAAVPAASIGEWHRRIAALPALRREPYARHVPDGASVPAEEHLAAILFDLGVRGLVTVDAASVDLAPLVTAVTTARKWLAGLFLAVRMFQHALAQPRGSDPARCALRWAAALVMLPQRLDAEEIVGSLRDGLDPLIRLDVAVRRRRRLACATAPVTDTEAPPGSLVRGRVARVRRHSGVTFADIDTGRGVLGLRLDHADPDRPDLAIDKGDWVTAAVAPAARGRTGPAEPLHWVEHQPNVLARSQVPVELPPPGLLRVQSAVLGEMTRFLHARGFLQCATPVLTDSFYGGASTPFLTVTQSGPACKALRVTSELALKSVIAAGHARCFEIGPMFRNESEDRRHLNSFTMLEYYATDLDVAAMTAFTVDLVSACARAAGAQSPPVRSAAAAELIAAALDLDIRTGSGIAALARHLRTDDPVGETAVAALIGHAVLTVVMPQHPELLIIDGLPAGASPLIKCDASQAARRWISYAGTFLADVAQEETDVATVSSALRTQFVAERYPVRRDYRNFMRLLAAGLPPVAGVGMGVSSLIAILAGLEDVRDGVLDQWQG
jgi:elongation factor P--beta-lysine ligase